MKVARVFALIFGILGLVLMLGTTAVCFGALDAPVRAEIPQAAKDCAEELAALLNAGDLNKVQEKLYSSPRLGTDGTLTEEAAMVWDIYLSGIACELTSEVYVSGSGFAVDAVVTVPKLESITDSVTEHGQTLLNERVAAAEKMAELYDDNGEFRKDVIDDVMKKAVKLAFGETPETVSVKTTFTLVYAENQWWAVPDTAFMQALRGGL